MQLKPLGSNFLFTFLSETKNGTFKQKSSGRIYIPNAAPSLSEQGILARWCKVEKIGEEVTDLEVGDIVLIKPLRWTIGYIFGEDDNNQLKYWKSNQCEVIAKTNDLDIAYDFHFE